MKAFLRQSWAVMAWNLRTLRQRLPSAAVIVTGFMAVVLVFVTVLAMRNGFEATLTRTGSADVAMIRTINIGTLDRQAVQRIGQAPGVAQGPQGPLISKGFLATVQMQRRNINLLGPVLMRGVDSHARAIWPGLRLVRGRLFKPGTHEVIVGRRAERLFAGLAPGDRFPLNGHAWKVVGVFADNGNVHESEIWTDVHVLQSAFGSPDRYTNIYVHLVSPSAFPGFKQALESEPDLNVAVTRESTFFEREATGLTTLITYAGSIVALLMAVGAIFGAVNILYTSVLNRAQDIATLRSLGFRRGPVLTTVLLEGLAYGLLGGILGALLAYGVFDGFPASTLGNYVLVAFNFLVTPGLMLTGIGFALLMGLAGGLFPAVKIGRMPVAAALREL